MSNIYEVIFGRDLYLMLGMCLRVIFTGVLVLEFVFITFRGSFQQDCESFAAWSNSTAISFQVSNHVQVDWSKSGCNDVCINLYITHVMIVWSLQLPSLPTPLAASWQIKTLLWNRMIIAFSMSFIHAIAKAAVFTIRYSLKSHLIWNSSKKLQ